MASKVDIFRRLGAFTLVILVLIGSMGFSMNIHYCKGVVKSYKIYGEAHKCYDKDLMKECVPSATEGVSISKTKCCKDALLDYRSSFESHHSFHASTQPIVQAYYFPAITEVRKDHFSGRSNFKEVDDPPGYLLGKKFIFIETFLI